MKAEESSRYVKASGPITSNPILASMEGIATSLFHFPAVQKMEDERSNSRSPVKIPGMVAAEDEKEEIPSNGIPSQYIHVLAAACVIRNCSNCCCNSAGGAECLCSVSPEEGERVTVLALATESWDVGRWM